MRSSTERAVGRRCDFVPPSVTQKMRESPEHQTLLTHPFNCEHAKTVGAISTGCAE